MGRRVLPGVPSNILFGGISGIAVPKFVSQKKEIFAAVGAYHKTERDSVKILSQKGEAMKNYNAAVNEMFSEKENLIIIGLTGRTGAGCTTASEILAKKLEELDLEYVSREDDIASDEFKFHIIKEYIGKDDRWLPFTRIEGSCVILSYIFEEKGKEDNFGEALIRYLTKIQGASSSVSFKIDNFGDLIKELRGLNYIFGEIQKHSLREIDIDWAGVCDEDIRTYYDLYINKLPEYKERIKKILLKYSCYEERKKKIQDEPPVKYHLYTYLLQKIGNNLRASGAPYTEQLAQDKILDFPKRMEQLIHLIIKHDKAEGRGKTRICIDAIRNANESNYLKDKFRPYYLFSVSVDEETRRKRLDNLDIDEKNSLDNVEYNSKLNLGEFFYHQNIAQCFEMADIHLVNEEVSNNKFFFLTWQLVKYITLMIHPGLITPSAVERCMQLAYNAKYNSGCLSRQVGAVITDGDYAVKAVGWNEVPGGQLSCLLRNVSDYCKGNMKECYSRYEYEDTEFRDAIAHINEQLKGTDTHGRKFPYCFKDVYNGYKNDKNQVYTRALHAEENAFLQISKYGGRGIRDGFLFCTASPCELCAKKAYQLGIKNIYYIDPYPGISEKHILTFGQSRKNPTMILFYGAIGEAYIRLYKPVLAYKDELELVTGMNCKRIVQKMKTDAKKGPDTKDFLYHLIDFSIVFKDRENIESFRKVDIEVKNGEYESLERKLTWTGSSYDKSELVNNGEGYRLEDSKDKASPYKYKIHLNKKIRESEHIRYELRTNVKDETHLMHPYFAQMIKHPTKELILNVIIPKSSRLIENVRYVRYADLKMECEYEDADAEHKIEEKEDGENIIYTLKISNPNLFYTYSIEWDFIKIKP